MDGNGESESNSMNLDPVSPGSSNPRGMLDEPAAPRRNSTDDNDPTRPRKRPAVMVASEDQREDAVVVCAALHIINDQNVLTFAGM